MPGVTRPAPSPSWTVPVLRVVFSPVHLVRARSNKGVRSQEEGLGKTTEHIYPYSNQTICSNGSNVGLGNQTIERKWALTAKSFGIYPMVLFHQILQLLGYGAFSFTSGHIFLSYISLENTHTTNDIQVPSRLMPLQSIRTDVACLVA